MTAWLHRVLGAGPRLDTRHPVPAIPGAPPVFLTHSQRAELDRAGQVPRNVPMSAAGIFAALWQLDPGAVRAGLGLRPVSEETAAAEDAAAQAAEAAEAERLATWAGAGSLRETRRAGVVATAAATAAAAARAAEEEAQAIAGLRGRVADYFRDHSDRYLDELGEPEAGGPGRSRLELAGAVERTLRTPGAHLGLPGDLLPRLVADALRLRVRLLSPDGPVEFGHPDHRQVTLVPVAPVQGLAGGRAARSLPDRRAPAGLGPPEGGRTRAATVLGGRRAGGPGGRSGADGPGDLGLAATPGAGHRHRDHSGDRLRGPDPGAAARRWPDHGRPGQRGRHAQW